MAGSLGQGRQRAPDFGNETDDAALDALLTAFQRAAVINATLLKLGCLDDPQLNPRAYRTAIDAAIQALEAAASAGEVRIAEQRIASRAQEQRRAQEALLRAREDEFNATVAVLTEAVVQFKAANSTYTDTVMRGSERMEQIAALTDLRMLRTRLLGELTALREATAARQAVEERQLGTLREQVGALEARLSVAVAQAYRDPLTGLHNRVGWDQRMAELAVQVENGDAAYALAVIDLDQFKAINDTHGHAAGDAALTEFGEFCGQAFGMDDFVARYGGDEFVVLLAAPEGSHAVEHLNRLMALVRRANEMRRERPTFTVSAGLVLVNRTDSIPALLERADAALYAAKRAGRDRLEIAAPVTASAA